MTTLSENILAEIRGGEIPDTLPNPGSFISPPHSNSLLASWLSLLARREQIAGLHPSN